MRLTLVRFALVALLLLGLSYNSSSQDLKLTVNPEKKFQTMEGFGASLAFYETWLIAHPKKAEIYEAIFNELREK